MRAGGALGAKLQEAAGGGEGDAALAVGKRPRLQSRRGDDLARIDTMLAKEGGHDREGAHPLPALRHCLCLP